MEDIINEEIINKEPGVVPEHVRAIKGWGIDADPENDPTYPMKRYNGADYQRSNYERASQQPQQVEILHSNERPDVTRVFGTASPPSGLSGMLRRYAFRFSEGSSGHWLTLLLADRVNVLEGIADDLIEGHVPNILDEKGWKSEWKHNRPAAIRKTVITAVVIASAVTWLVINNKKKNAISTDRA